MVLHMEDIIVGRGLQSKFCKVVFSGLHSSRTVMVGCLNASILILCILKTRLIPFILEIVQSNAFFFFLRTLSSVLSSNLDKELLIIARFSASSPRKTLNILQMRRKLFQLWNSFFMHFSHLQLFLPVNSFNL